MITTSRLALRWLCIFCWAACCQAAPTGVPERLVALKAVVTVKNNGDVALDRYIHRLTIPADDHAQQRLLHIEYPYPDRYTLRSHDNGIDHYMKFKWDVPPRSQLTREVVFHLRLTAFDHDRNPIRQSSRSSREFLAPSERVESDATEVVAIARRIEGAYPSARQRLFAAFQYPQKTIRYREMENRGALFALREGIGDCTEFAALFVAISRALGIPARMTSEFHFSTDTAFSAPNHHAAEAYLDGAWIPVDPNLALTPSLGYGFGHGTTRKVVLKRGDSWTWSNTIPRTTKAYRDAHVDVDVRWSVSSAD